MKPLSLTRYPDAAQPRAGVCLRSERVKRKSCSELSYSLGFGAGRESATGSSDFHEYRDFRVADIFLELPSVLEDERRNCESGP